MRRAGNLSACVALVLTAGGGCSPDGSQANGSSARGSEVASHSCAIGLPTNAKYFVQNDETPFYEEPDKTSAKVINARATEVLEHTEYRDLWTANVLQGICETPEWLQAKIVESDGEPVEWETGWVEKSAVRTDASDAFKAGLLWNVDKETEFSASEKVLVKKGALKVLHDEPNCEKIIYGAWSEKRNGEVFVSCAPKSGEAFNVWYSLAEVKSGKSLAAPVAFNESASRQMCNDAIRSRINHPSTLDLHSILGYATKTYNNGNREIVQGFSAKNAFNLELEYTARCLVMPNGRLEISIAESQ